MHENQNANLFAAWAANRMGKADYYRSIMEFIGDRTKNNNNSLTFQ
jgi:hypothetical protein